MKKLNVGGLIALIIAVIGIILYKYYLGAFAIIVASESFDDETNNSTCIWAIIIGAINVFFMLFKLKAMLWGI